MDESVHDHHWHVYTLLRGLSSPIRPQPVFIYQWNEDAYPSKEGLLHALGNAINQSDPDLSPFAFGTAIDVAAETGRYPAPSGTYVGWVECPEGQRCVRVKTDLAQFQRDQLTIQAGTLQYTVQHNNLHI